MPASIRLQGLFEVGSSFAMTKVIALVSRENALSGRQASLVPAWRPCPFEADTSGQWLHGSIHDLVSIKVSHIMTVAETVTETVKDAVGMGAREQQPRKSALTALTGPSQTNQPRNLRTRPGPSC